MSISMSLISFQFRETCDGGHEHRYKTQYHPKRFVGQFFLAKKKKKKRKVLISSMILSWTRALKRGTRLTYSSAPTLHHHLPDLSPSTFYGGKTGRDDG